MSSELNLNRLNLPNMVGRQLKGVPLSVEKYFSPLVITGKRKTLEERQSNRAEISTSINSIVATVHNKLRTQKVRKVEQPKITEEEPKSVDEPAVEVLANHLPKVRSEMVETKIDSKIKTQKFTLPLKATSIPQIKAVRAHKQQQHMRRNIIKITDYNDPISEKRILQVKEQRRILQDMLMQHQRLQRDRQSIAMEIQTMREHLSDIRHKLDVSLRRLTTKPNVNSQALLKPKVFLRPQKLNGSYVRKSPSPSAKTSAPHSILKVSPNATSKSTNTTAKPANSPMRSKQSPKRNSSSPSRNTKR